MGRPLRVHAVAMLWRLKGEPRRVLRMTCWQLLKDRILEDVRLLRRERLRSR